VSARCSTAAKTPTYHADRRLTSRLCEAGGPFTGLIASREIRRHGLAAS
jgi:hypothetical protein